MPNLKHKSIENQKAAELIDKNQIDGIASVHSIYYSIFQLIKYIIKEHLGIDYQVQEKLIKDKQNSHVIIINILKKDIINNHKSSLSQISRDFGELKLRRTIADYQKKGLTQEEIKECIDIANNLRNELSTIYI